MKRISIAIFLLCISMMFSSCAYMQTNKNVKESFCHYQGYKISVPTCVYSAGGNWYLQADKVVLEKKYPVIYDKVLLDQNNEPTYKEIANVPHGTQKIYHPISSGTAKVLLRNDGYATLESLLDEMARSGKTWVELPENRLRKHQIKAEIAVRKEKTVMLAGQRTPQELPASADVLGGITKVVVDWPGTLVYNVAIPFMAPFVFFHDFLSTE